MDSKNVLFSSKTMELSEHKTYLELLNRVCFYDEKNLNDVLLPLDGAEEKAKTLIDMPVKAKYLVNANGEPDLGGHEAYIDNDGDVAFATTPIGTHTEVFVKDDLVEVGGVLRTLPCLFAKMKIWKENKNFVAAIKRLYAENNLRNSWEIISSEYSYSNGVKKLIDYVFTGNALLGSMKEPAYGKASKVLSLASTDGDYELLVATSLSKDLLEKTTAEKEEVDLDNEENRSEEIKESSEEVEETKTEEIEVKSDEPEMSQEDSDNSNEIASLTEYELRKKLNEAVKSKVDGWAWLVYHFPIEKTILVEWEYSESELEYLRFTYQVIDDEIILSDSEKVKLVVSVAEINDAIEKLNSEIAEKNAALLSANETIQALNTEVSNLSPFKEKFEEAEQIRISAELLKKQEEITAYALKTKLISESDLEDTDIKKHIEDVDYASLDKIILARFMSSLEKNGTEVSEVKKEADKKPDTQRAKVELSSADDTAKDPRSYMSQYINYQGKR